MENKKAISDELLAAYLDGRTNKEETMQVLNVLKTDKHLQEVLNIALQTDEQTLPILQMAALGGENVCAVQCEAFILQHHHVNFDEEWLINTARKEGWLKQEEPASPSG